MMRPVTLRGVDAIGYFEIRFSIDYVPPRYHVFRIGEHRFTVNSTEHIVTVGEGELFCDVSWAGLFDRQERPLVLDFTTLPASVRITRLEQGSACER